MKRLLGQSTVQVAQEYVHSAQPAPQQTSGAATGLPSGSVSERRCRSRTVSDTGTLSDTGNGHTPGNGGVRGASGPAVEERLVVTPAHADPTRRVRIPRKERKDDRREGYYLSRTTLLCSNVVVNSLATKPDAHRMNNGKLLSNKCIFLSLLIPSTAGQDLGQGEWISQNRSF